MKQLAFISFSLLSIALLPCTLLNSLQAATPHYISPTSVNVLVRSPTEADALKLQFNNSIRWQQVLAQLQTAQLDPSWSQLTKPSEQAKYESLRTQVLKDLHVLGQHWARKGKQGLLRSSVALANQIKDLSLVARQPVSNNYDLVRIDNHFNPLLSGDYELQLQPRPNVVWTQGLVRLSGKRPFVGAGFAYDYGRRLSLLAGAEKQRMWIIQPDGEITSSAVDPFAPQFVGVAPGATLYVGFASLPAEFSDLNQRIMTLFANREI